MNLEAGYGFGEQLDNWQLVGAPGLTFAALEACLNLLRARSLNIILKTTRFLGKKFNIALCH